ncbi:MAG TPA: MerR family transcriptional regulator [Acidimicrobiales bacterium]|nr:MerR family transcriptional regulator [Acidimicrobiales bacterium]
MGERSYLSIGDVLALLREEFPDITISKIRFLESRGLLVPERTPSGYRKFYDHDVERLRWILRQQREHFLPLKVIKGRLEGAESTTDRESLFDSGETPPATIAGSSRPGLSAVSSANGNAHPSSGHAPGGELAARVATMQRREGPGHHEGAAFAEARRASRPATGEHDRPVPEPTGPRTAGEPASSPAPPPAVPEPPSTPAPSVADLAGSLAGAALTAGELAQASGLSVSQVEQLESFGLIGGRSVAGVHCFDEDCVAVAKLAAGFAAFGIEARHLRLFKHAAERQAGLYSQAIMPLLRQRNPHARARALEDLGKLADLGTSLQAAFVKAILRDLTG